MALDVPYRSIPDMLRQRVAATPDRDALGLFVSTLTEQPIGATIATLVLTVGSEILDAIPQVAVIHRYLPTHYWLAYADLLRDPVGFDQIRPGLFSAAAYVAIFGAAAWARFSGRDVTS